MAQKTTQRPVHPRRDYENALIALALTEVLSRDGNEPPFSELPPEERTALALSAQHLQDRLPELIRRGRRRSFADLLRAALPALKTAAIIILIANLTLTLALATNDTLRATVIRYLIDQKDDHYLFYREVAETRVEVPEVWTGLFYPAYIPEGLTLSKVSDEPLIHIAEYYTHDAEKFCFSVYPDSSVIAYDNSSPIQTIAINGYAASVVTGKTETLIMWYQEGCLITLSFSGPYEELLRAAQSVVQIP